MAMPRIKLSMTMSGTFLDFVMREPRWLPIGVMDASVPSVNRPMPIIRKNTAIIKASMRSVDIGTKKRHSSATISAIGATEAIDSRSFSPSMVFICIAYPLRFQIFAVHPEAGQAYAEQDEECEKYAWIEPYILKNRQYCNTAEG